MIDAPSQETPMQSIDEIPGRTDGMTRLGKNQLSLLRAVGTTAAVVVPCDRSKRLCELGLMKSVGEDGSFAHITPNGLRALADAVDAGQIELFVMPDNRAKGGQTDG